jgi:integrase
LGQLPKSSTAIKALLALAHSEGWHDVNPAQGLQINVALARVGKGDKTFTPAQLQHIMANASAALSSDALLALRALIWGGFRGEEVCQLRCEDVTEVGGRTAVHIRERHALQSIKNPSSERIVPLHRAIADDIRAKAKNGKGWLFPSFGHATKHKHASALKTAFNGRREPDGAYVGLLRKVCGITDPKLTLHSIRHAFKDACRRARIEKETYNELMGHGAGCISDEYGSEMFDLMADVIDDVDPLSAVLKPRRSH